MITEANIAKFDAAKQREIRLRIEKLVKNGSPRKFLYLRPDGTVVYNGQAHLDALELGEADD
jgi:hypothetical protein